MKTVYETALEMLRHGEKGVLAVILTNEGSTPRDEGAKMLIRENGTIFGTIGGGPMEYAVMKKSPETLASGSADILVFDLYGKDVRNSPSVCGGHAKVCLYPLNESDIPALEPVCAPDSRQRQAALLILRDMDTGMIRLACSTGKALPEGEILYREEPEVKNRLYLIGGGHVCEATAKVAVVAGFDIVVMDDREEFANQERFPGAQCIVCKEYDELPAEWVTDTDYILIATRGHKADHVGLRWALSTKACYVGMIGSRTKRDLVYAALEKEGVSRERLQWVHSPVGLPIGGRTPGDIAVSVMAEIVDVRAREMGIGNVFKKKEASG